jgi:hypothetical protein
MQAPIVHDGGRESDHILWLERCWIRARPHL